MPNISVTRYKKMMKNEFLVSENENIRGFNSIKDISKEAVEWKRTRYIKFKVFN